VVYFTLPSGWAILTSSVRALDSTGNWLDPSMACGHLSNVTVTGTIWAQVATAAAAWIVFRWQQGQPACCGARSL